MPAPTTTTSFLDLLRKSNLVPADRLEPALESLGPGDDIPPKQLAEELIAAGLLTHFQARHLLAGKSRGFDLGKFRILEKIGSGASGTVYLCEHTLMQRRVAVKVLPSSRASQPNLLARFHREARAAAVLNHPNLVRGHDIDQEGNIHFLVMDYVDGSSLLEIVAQSGPMPATRACHYFHQAALGLQHAHEHGLIHRDVKPANILVDRTGLVKVLDLGLARFFQDEDDMLSVKYDDCHVMGSLDFISPEQARDSHRVDPRTDIYSLAATFYYVLTGRTLFPEGKPSEKLMWHQVETPEPVDALCPEVPWEVARLIDRMLAKHADDRPQTLIEVAEVLVPWTQEPIAPPSEAEMPRFCLAAQATRSRGGQLRSREIALSEVTQGLHTSQTPTHPDVEPPPIRPSRKRRPEPVLEPVEEPVPAPSNRGFVAVVLALVVGIATALVVGIWSR